MPQNPLRNFLGLGAGWKKKEKRRKALSFMMIMLIIRLKLKRVCKLCAIFIRREGRKTKSSLFFFSHTSTAGLGRFLTIFLLASLKLIGCFFCLSILREKTKMKASLAKNWL